MGRGAAEIPALRLILAALAFGAFSPAAAAACVMAPTDRSWIDAALTNWTVAERDLLKLVPAPVPTIVAVDATCTYIGRGKAIPLDWTGSVHEGSVRLPDGATFAVGVMSFAGQVSTPKEPFFVMTLPSVWRAAGITSPLGLERMLDGVLLHEMAHSRQLEFAGPMLAALEAGTSLPDDFSDDSLQEKFQADPAYAAAFRAEVDTLYRALFEPDAAKARALMRQGIVMMDQRQARWLGGPTGDWARADNLFLGMEGLGQWVFYRWATRGVVPAADRRPDPAAVESTRRNRKWWSQDEGLALFLLLDRFHPDWRAGGAAADPSRLRSLLAAAVEPNR